jgi:hypothetical protein
LAGLIGISVGFSAKHRLEPLKKFPQLENIEFVMQGRLSTDRDCSPPDIDAEPGDAGAAFGVFTFLGL